MGSQDFKIIFECDDYSSRKNPDDCGLVEIDATANFSEEEIESVTIDEVWCTDDERPVVLSDKDKAKAMIYLQARAWDRHQFWVAEERVAEGERRWESIEER